MGRPPIPATSPSSRKCAPASCGKPGLKLAGGGACPTTGYDEYVAPALVLSAGGMYAAWEVGVWKALRERIAIDLVVGASAGAWNGWALK